MESSTPKKPATRADAAYLLMLGFVGSAVTHYLTLVPHICLILASIGIIVGLAGLIDPRIYHAALKKPGEDISLYPTWIRASAWACWIVSFIVLALLLLGII